MKQKRSFKEIKESKLTLVALSKVFYIIHYNQFLVFPLELFCQLIFNSFLHIERKIFIKCIKYLILMLNMVAIFDLYQEYLFIFIYI